MKWIAFAGMIAVGVPLMTLAAMQMQRARTALFGLLVLTTVVKISVNFMSMEDYRGPDRGFEVHLTDLIALSLGLSMIFKRPGKLVWWPCNTAFLAILFGCALISTATATAPTLACFTLFKWAKAYFLYWVVYNFTRLEYPIDGLFYGLIGLAGMETLMVLRQKYLMGMYRPFGTFDHSNTIPCFLIMVIPLLLAWVSNGQRMNKWRSTLAFIAILGMCVCIVATVSRAGIALLGIAVIAVLFRQLMLGISTRKVGVTILIVLAMAAGLVKCADTLIDRLINAPRASSQARGEFNLAADMMAAENFFGVGLNCFSHAMTETRKYRRHVRVMQNEQHSGVCHNIYKLTAAELGNIGLLALMAVIGRFYLRMSRRALGRESLDRSLLSGLLIGFACVHVIGLLEWVFRLTPVINMFLILSAVGCVLAERLAAAPARRPLPISSPPDAEPSPAGTGA